MANADYNFDITPFDARTAKLLKQQGAPVHEFIHRGSIQLDNMVRSFTPDIPRLQPKKVSAQKQLSDLASLFANTIHRQPYILSINSYPDDNLAKITAMYLMSLALKQRLEDKTSVRSLPLWHKVYGGFGDDLRDKPRSDLPSLLIISNVTDESSNYKLEKVRDLLAIYEACPRIVVSGAVDPKTFFANKLRIKENCCIHLAQSLMESVV